LTIGEIMGPILCPRLTITPERSQPSGKTHVQSNGPLAHPMHTLHRPPPPSYLRLIFIEDIHHATSVDETPLRHIVETCHLQHGRSHATPHLDPSSQHLLQNDTSGRERGTTWVSPSFDPRDLDVGFPLDKLTLPTEFTWWPGVFIPSIYLVVNMIATMTMPSKEVSDTRRR
jgi:hypothetical protein